MKTRAETHGDEALSAAGARQLDVYCDGGERPELDFPVGQDSRKVRGTGRGVREIIQRDGGRRSKRNFHLRLVQPTVGGVYRPRVPHRGKRIGRRSLSWVA